MANTVAYRKFKRQVLQNAQFECEICGTSDGLTVHHMLKQSTFPQYRLDPVNGVCLCGKCHSEIESRLREKEDIDKYLHNRICKAFLHFKCKWEDLGVKTEKDDMWEEDRTYGGL